VVGALLAADASAAGAADGSRRLPLALVASACCSGEALALLHAAHPAVGLEIGPVAEYIARTAETTADVDALLATAAAGAVGAVLPGPRGWRAGRRGCATAGEAEAGWRAGRDGQRD
jgi:hypothetical protein